MIFSNSIEPCICKLLDWRLSLCFLGPQPQSLGDFWSSHSSWHWGCYTLQHGISASQGWANVQTEIKSDWDVQPFSHSLSILSYSFFGKTTQMISVLISIVLVYSYISLIFSLSSLLYFSLLLIFKLPLLASVQSWVTPAQATALLVSFSHCALLVSFFWLFKCTFGVFFCLHLCTIGLFFLTPFVHFWTLFFHTFSLPFWVLLALHNVYFVQYIFPRNRTSSDLS